MTAYPAPDAPVRYEVYGGWLVEVSDSCTCAASGLSLSGHEPGCGMEPIAKVADLLALHEKHVLGIDLEGDEEFFGFEPDDDGDQDLVDTISPVQSDDPEPTTQSTTTENED